MMALSSAPIPESVGEVYFDTEDSMAYIWNGYQWNEYRGPQGIQGPMGPQGIQGPKGYKGDTGPQGPSNLINNYGISRIRDCCQKTSYRHTGEGDDDYACVLWPWSTEACRHLMCDELRHRTWQVNEFDSNGNHTNHWGGSCGNW